MEVIIVQGMACVGKTTLCEKLQRDLPNCKVESFDTWKEKYWDMHGFASVDQREALSRLAWQYYLRNLQSLLGIQPYEYLLLEYPFSDKYWGDLDKLLEEYGIEARTIYLKPDNTQEHMKVWEERSRDFTQRHPGHGASSYIDCVGAGYSNNCNIKIFDKMPVTTKYLYVTVHFNPYAMSKSYDEILQYVQEVSNEEE